MISTASSKTSLSKTSIKKKIITVAVDKIIPLLQFDTVALTKAKVPGLYLQSFGVISANVNRVKKKKGHFYELTF